MTPARRAAFLAAGLTPEDAEAHEQGLARRKAAQDARRAAWTPAQRAAYLAHERVLMARGWPDVDAPDFDDAWREAVRVRGEMDAGYRGGAA